MMANAKIYDLLTSPSPCFKSLAQYKEPSPKQTFPTKSSQIQFVNMSLPGPNAAQKLNPTYGTMENPNAVKLLSDIGAVPSSKPHVMACAPKQRQNKEAAGELTAYSGVSPKLITEEGWNRHLRERKEAVSPWPYLPCYGGGLPCG